MVNEQYPGDCLQYKRILDTTQPIYQVPGKPASALQESVSVGNGGDGGSQENRDSIHSLQIKQVKEEAQEISETQPRYEVSRKISCPHVVEMLTSENQYGFRGAVVIN